MRAPARQRYVNSALSGASVLAARPVKNTSLKIKNSATAPKIQHIKLIELNITSRQTIRQALRIKMSATQVSTHRN
ncbi:Uncharacterised protein [Mycobacterium tuberculosis]|nr:Uncharacterised protein [Mycobacterium tuberculosis]